MVPSSPLPARGEEAGGGAHHAERGSSISPCCSFRILWYHVLCWGALGRPAR